MTEHTLRLHKGPFDLIASGSKTIEARLYDEKRQTLQVGDTLVFVSRDDPTQTIKAKVTGLLRYDNFAEMFQANDPHKFGGPSVD